MKSTIWVLAIVMALGMGPTVVLLEPSPLSLLAPSLCRGRLNGRQHPSITENGRGALLLGVPTRARARDCVGATSQTSPRNYPESCPQRAPKKAEVTFVRSANLRRVVCGSLARVSIQKGLITQRSSVQIRPPDLNRRPSRYVLERARRTYLG